MRWIRDRAVVGVGVRIRIRGWFRDRVGVGVRIRVGFTVR